MKGCENCSGDNGPLALEYRVEVTAEGCGSRDDMNRYSHYGMYTLPQSRESQGRSEDSHVGSQLPCMAGSGDITHLGPWIQKIPDTCPHCYTEEGHLHCI